MNMSVKSDYLFEIDFNKWNLLKHPETGELKDPVSLDNFEGFEYWDDKSHRPVRQIMVKNGMSNYADYLDTETGELDRRPSSLLGVSPYDDEISKEEYEELCQTVMLEYHYKRLINDETLMPFQRLGLEYLKSQGLILILKHKTLFAVDHRDRKVIHIGWDKDLIKSSVKISEYEYYYSVINNIIRINGNISIYDIGKEEEKSSIERPGKLLFLKLIKLFNKKGIQ